MQTRSVASAIGAPTIPMGILHSGLLIAQSRVSPKKSAFTVELNSSKVENIVPVLLKTKGYQMQWHEALYLK
jgi:hypothetical protein